ncbi:hypothetical protein [Motiliproteus sp. MSK22-1]|uniref:hypothetical protein n=1 Tax=Motiliproteus sp. MSK22-1 TaxID=1897630 RepID=UPI0013014035|nr:hypothetical protein [Motiliproteus sp. MSK22-1]
MRIDIRDKKILLDGKAFQPTLIDYELNVDVLKNPISSKYVPNKKNIEIVNFINKN